MWLLYLKKDLGIILITLIRVRSGVCSPKHHLSWVIFHVHMTKTHNCFCRVEISLIFLSLQYAFYYFAFFTIVCNFLYLRPFLCSCWFYFWKCSLNYFNIPSLFKSPLYSFVQDYLLWLYFTCWYLQTILLMLR